MGKRDFFAHKVMQIPNIETVFESKLVCNLLNPAVANLLLTSIFSATLRTQTFLSTQFWSLSDLVLEYCVKFDRSIEKKCLIRKNYWFFFRFAKIFKFFVVALRQQKRELFEPKV